MVQLLDRLEKVRGLPVLIGVAFAVLNFAVQCIAYPLLSGGEEVGFLLYLLTHGNLLLHIGVAVGLLGVLIGDIL
jgi:hypothetical protein